VLHRGILEGRKSFGNVMKYLLMGTSSNFGNMFSMAGATLFLTFLPMLPVQILLNNLLYDVSELTIPVDRVDHEYLAHPKHWDTDFIRNFMWVVGPVSSIFDILTFLIMLKVFEAGEALFHTGWFIESIATQVLVIFVIRTRASPFASRPAPLLVATSIAVVAAAALVPWTPLAAYFGFVPPPLAFYGAVAAMVASYLVLVQWVKLRFYQLHPAA
jgi:P-type Mg2+ transporter